MTVLYEAGFLEREKRGRQSDTIGTQPFWRARRDSGFSSRGG
jgi:hypothetical protein